VKVKLNSLAPRIISSVLVVLQAGVLPAAAAAPPAGAFAAMPTAAPQVAVNRSAPALRALPTEPSFSADPSDSEIVRARVFAEPFVPVAGARQGSENVDLARVIRDQARSTTPDDVTRFEVYLRDHPSSRWSGAVLLGVGIVYRQTGYLTRALDRLERAWTLLEKETEPRAKALGDRALAELADLNARLGRAERLEALFAAVQRRDVRGPAAEKLAATESVIAAARIEPHRAFRCGPMALERALAARTLPDGARQRIFKEASTINGTSLSQLLRLSQEISVPMQMAWREPGAEVIAPAVVHWKSGHFAAITADDGRRSLVDDPVLGGQMSVSRPALDEEASGAFLVPAGQLPNGWRSLSGSEGDLYWGRGLAPDADPKEFGCFPVSSGGNKGSSGGNNGSSGGDSGSSAGDTCLSGNCGMAGYKVNLMLVNLHVSDSPVGYEPPVGPTMRFTLAYNQREYFQPQIPSYSSFGPKWTFGWFSYVEDSPTDPNQSPNVYRPLGGVETYSNYNAGTQTYGIHYRSRAVLARTSSTAYERRLPDGSVEVFAQSDGSTVYPRRVFLTAIRDGQGNQVSFGYTYDVPTGALRLSSATDAIGQVTTFQYGGSDPLKITRVTDPFGRYASFEYDPTGRLTRITDVIAITSEFTYGTNDFISSLTTPYGTTSFQTGMSGTDRWLEATDPLGAKERFERVGSTPGIAYAEPTAVLPTGMATTNIYINARNTFYWDKRAMASMPYSVDYRKARITHWLHSYFNNNQTSGTIESVKSPLENRVWYNYPGNQGAPAYEGTATNPTIVGRVLDDGTTQLYRYEYNSKGKKIKETDPLGRETVYVYGTGSTPDPDQANGTGTDLLQVKQKNPSAPGGYDLIASYTYNAQQLPLTVTDAAGQTTTSTFNAQGQILTVTTPPRAGITENRTTTYSYDTNGFLQSVTAPATGATTNFTYDGYGRTRTVTDQDSYTVTYDYDALDRVTRITYPDTTYEETVYNRLDAEKRRDRLGRWTHIFHDALRRIVATRDPAGRTTTQQWCSCGSLDKLIDSDNNATTWERDLQGRVTREVPADGADWEYTYETTTSRLKKVKDAKDQETQYSYFLDSKLQQVSYPTAQVTTPSVSYTYDSTYDRIATMVDGTGTTTFTYHPVTATPTLGATQLSTVDGPLTNDTISYGYDELGRRVSRTLNGVSTSWAYDVLSRLTTLGDPLGAFTYTYEGTTGRRASLTYPNGQTTTYAYFPNSGDRNVQEIHHRTSAGGSTLAKLTHGYDVMGNVSLWTQQYGASAANAYDFKYDLADQLESSVYRTTDPTPVTLKRYGYAYDPVGNRTTEQIDDAPMQSSYDTRNRLASQQPGGALLFKGSVSETSTVTVGGKPATVGSDNNFQGTAPVATGTSTTVVTATDPSGNQRTNTYQVTISGATKTFTYDANGSLTAEGAKTYEWDGANRLVRVLDGGAEVARFVYDGLGRRAQKVSGGVTRTYVYEAENALEERLSSGATIRYVHAPGIDQPVAGVQSGTTTYYLADHLGSILLATDASAAVTLTRQYDPWGNLLQGSTTAGYAFTGREWDPEIGLYYYRARYYDPKIGRFISEDPLELKDRAFGELNPYAYVANNPVNRVDPLGLQSCPSNHGADCSGRYVECRWRALILLNVSARAACAAACTAGGPIGIWKCRLSCSAAIGAVQAAWLAGCDAEYAECLRNSRD
jgi:RHS repeat-associated protein